MTFKDILQFSIGPLGSAGLSFISMPIVAWFFPVASIGKLSMLQVCLGFAVMLFSLGMHQAYVREFHEENDKPRLLKSVVLPGLILLSLTLFLICLLPISFSNLLFDIESKLISTLFIISVFASFFINFLSHILRMEERGLAFSVTQIMPKATFLLLLGFIILFNLENSFSNLMFIQTVALVASVVTFVYITKNVLIPSVFASIDTNFIKKLLKFSLPLVAGSLAYWGLTSMDKFFIRYLLGFEELGAYAMAVTLSGAVGILSTIFGNLWHPTVYKWVKSDVDPVKVQQVIDFMFLGVVFVWSVVGLFSWLPLCFLPEGYFEVEYLLVACVSIPLFYMLSETTVVGIGITRKSMYAMLAPISAFVLNLVLNYFLIPIYGVAGAAVATVFSFFVFFIVRTEASAYLWVSFPRGKMYFLLLCYIFATIAFMLTKAKLDFFYFVWIALLLLSAFFYVGRIYMIYNYLSHYIKRKM